MNYFQFEDHVRIEKAIRECVKCDWIITYDDTAEIQDIYSDYLMYLYDLNYSVSSKCKASEIIMFKSGIEVPNDEELQKQRVKINIRLYVT